MRAQNWFEVSREGLRELYGSMRPGRLVLELVQNAWDEATTVCSVAIAPDVDSGRRVTRVTVVDDSPDGFRNLADAYTLFGTTTKRLDPSKRGRFSYGDKLVLARALRARVSSTTGEILFGPNGRGTSRRRRAAGSEIEVVFPRWSVQEQAEAEEFIRRLIAPAAVTFTLNGAPVERRTPDKVTQAALTTEILQTVGDGPTAMTRTVRRTSIEFYAKAADSAYLYEMGIPVCTIAGACDISVCQKIPLSQCRTAVPEFYLQDIYAEEVLAFGSNLDVQTLGAEIVQLALADVRMDPATAKTVFHRIYGEEAAIQSLEPDADQKAVREGMVLVSPRTFGKDVNDKLREGGVQTTHELFGERTCEAAGIIHPAEYTPAQRNFVAYATMLARLLAPETRFSIGLGRWSRCDWSAFNQDRTMLVFHVDRVDVERPVTGAHTTCLHELAHAHGHEHDGVYDKAFEALVGKATTLLAAHPELFRPFELGAFPAAMGSIS